MPRDFLKLLTQSFNIGSKNHLIKLDDITLIQLVPITKDWGEEINKTPEVKLYSIATREDKVFYGCFQITKEDSGLEDNLVLVNVGKNYFMEQFITQWQDGIIPIFEISEFDALVGVI